jgi:3-dehydroquinate synthase II/3-amino-4-hydroxybenzoic acid synthase
MQNKKLIWYDARGLDSGNKLFSLLFTLNFEYLIVSLNTFSELKSPKKIKYIIEIKTEEDINKLTDDVYVLSDDQKLLTKALKKGFKTVFYHEVMDQDTMNKGWEIGRKYDFLLVFFKSETNIPLELLIAKLQKENTIILKQVNDFEDAEISFGVMEHGCHGVVFNSKKSEELLKFDNYMKQIEIGSLVLVKAKVTCVEHIGMGHRSCIDTTTMLRKDEGMIIGSLSGGGLLVSSETHFLPYMELRPFRVNAGAIHSYIWCMDGMTKYISELFLFFTLW